MIIERITLNQQAGATPLYLIRRREGFMKRWRYFNGEFWTFNVMKAFFFTSEVAANMTVGHLSKIK